MVGRAQVAPTAFRLAPASLCPRNPPSIPRGHPACSQTLQAARACRCEAGVKRWARVDWRRRCLARRFESSRGWVRVRVCRPRVPASVRLTFWRKRTGGQAGGRRRASEAMAYRGTRSFLPSCAVDWGSKWTWQSHGQFTQRSVSSPNSPASTCRGGPRRRASATSLVLLCQLTQTHRRASSCLLVHTLGLAALACGQAWRAGATRRAASRQIHPPPSRRFLRPVLASRLGGRGDCANGEWLSSR